MYGVILTYVTSGKEKGGGGSGLSAKRSERKRGARRKDELYNGVMKGGNDKERGRSPTARCVKVVHGCTKTSGATPCERRKSWRTTRMDEKGDGRGRM